jgi:uncharacterized membrane protein
VDDFAVTITVPRPAHAVFGFLAEPTNLPLWLEAVTSVRFDDAPPRRGARFEMVRSLPGGLAVNDVELVEFEPSRRVALASCAGPTPFRYEYALQPTGNSTRVALRGRISGEDMRGPVARLDAIATQLFKRGMQRNLRTLARLLSVGAVSEDPT